ncbi:HlyD family type I secretion periplasmic adaptor subunit [Legionella oakridgensis]|uniref:HlyD family type I secretion periplasmic adaptor subunit n=1 Tax=Legionella oakridgensis TaxID=29423 RepID=UPI0003DE4ECD|nr:HlyD family type I secretion periplasmic adaptor subunit [Legionella oakridgensis]ETO92378.1 type I secretion membrane fusion protein, HlyD family [Legionella oakridgensis RV-2-2007]
MLINHAPNIKKIIFYSFLVIFIFFGGFLMWATLAPLESAAIAPGKVIVAGNRRVIQHWEGGIIKKLYVKDGSTIKESDLLIKLDDIQAKAAAQINQNDYWELLGVQARLYAEIDQEKSIQFPPVLLHTNDIKAQEIIKLQQAIFMSNQKNFNDTVNIYKQRIGQLQEQIRGKQAQLMANQEQFGYINQELKDVRILATKKLIKQSRLLALQREAANLAGKQGEAQSAIAELEQKIGETKLEIIAMTDKQRKELLAELRETQKKLNEAYERMKASSDTLIRTEIRSPITGTVINLKVHTVGGVIKPGEPIMDIVPTHEALIIEAKLNPLDIDVVQRGLPAKVTLSGLSRRNTPTLLGQVIHVSADVLLDSQTNKPYFDVQVEIPAQELKKLNQQILYPGMPAEVMIITKKATPWEYFTAPILKSFNRAFRED